MPKPEPEKPKYKIAHVGHHLMEAEKALNDFAKEGWRVLQVIPNAGDAALWTVLLERNA